MALIVGAVGCGRINFAPLDRTEPIDTTLVDASNCTVQAFDTDTLPPDLEMFAGGGVTVMNGQLHTTIPGTPGIDSAVKTIPDRSFVGFSVAIEMVQVGMFTMAGTGPGLHGPTDSLHLHVSQNTLVLFESGGTINSAPYDPLMHRWIRLRETGGTLFGETSNDGTTYEIFGMTATFDLSSAFYDVGINPGGSGLPGSDTAIFDHLTTCPP